VGKQRAEVGLFYLVFLDIQPEKQVTLRWRFEGNIKWEVLVNFLFLWGLVL
jgi:hypothetical protein